MHWNNHGCDNYDMENEASNNWKEENGIISIWSWRQVALGLIYLLTQQYQYNRVYLIMVINKHYHTYRMECPVSNQWVFR